MEEQDGEQEQGQGDSTQQYGEPEEQGDTGDQRHLHRDQLHCRLGLWLDRGSSLQHVLGLHMYSNIEGPYDHSHFHHHHHYQAHHIEICGDEGIH